jgi:type IV pilus assembly protein PilM
MEDHLNLFHEAGLNPVIVDTDVFALENEYEMNREFHEAVVALVDIGASAMHVNILRDGLTLFQRDIALGGKRYNDVLQNEFGISYEEAEASKMGVGFSEACGAEQVLPLLLAVSEELSEELKRSLDFFRTMVASDIGIDKMVISGGCARIKGLNQLFSARLGVPVEVANPFRNIHYNGKLFDPEYLQDMAPVAAVGVGLAMRRIGDR